MFVSHLSYTPICLFLMSLHIELKMVFLKSVLVCFIKKAINSLIIMMDYLILSKLITTIILKDKEKRDNEEKRQNIRKKSYERKRNGIHSTSSHSFHSLWICVALLLLNMMKSCEAFDKLPNGNGCCTGCYENSLSCTDSSLGGVVEEWISGGTKRDVIVNKYGEIRNWNTSDVIGLQNVFRRKITFNEDISKWDVSSVTNMHLSTPLSFFLSLSVLVFINIF